MEIDRAAWGLLLVYVTFLGLHAVFLFIKLTAINGSLQVSALFIYILFIVLTIITLGSVDFSRATIRWETPAVAALIFSIATLLLEKSFTIFALVVVIASMLILTSSSLPFPASRVAKAIGAATAGVVILHITTLVWDAPVDPLLLKFLVVRRNGRVSRGIHCRIALPTRILLHLARSNRGGGSLCDSNRWGLAPRTTSINSFQNLCRRCVYSKCLLVCNVPRGVRRVGNYLPSQSPSCKEDAT